MQITNVTCPESKYAIKCPDITKKDGICIFCSSTERIL